MAIRILIFEDNDRLRESLVYLLHTAEDYEVVGDFNNCAEAATLVRVYQPDIVLMDIDMPVHNGIEGVKQVKEARPGQPLLCTPLLRMTKNCSAVFVQVPMDTCLKKHRPPVYLMLSRKYWTAELLCPQLLPAKF